MNRLGRDLTRVVFTIVLLLSSPALAENVSPNIVLIISDDQAWTDYGFMGHAHIQTPHLDRLARQSLMFTRGYVPSSLCRPSLATMITGLYPHQHGITGNDPTLPDPGVNAMASRRNPKYTRFYETLMQRIELHPTLPRLLGEKGYLSLQTGKWWEGPPRRGGFTYAMTHGDPARGGRHGDVGLKVGREGLQPIVDFLNEASAKEEPFFLWYAPFLPHTPHNPPERLLAKYRDKTPFLPIAKYWAMCQWFDETCGQLLDHLEARKLSENTLVLYVCDNGWIQRPDAGRFAPRSKRSPYEGGVRTPIMVRWPGRVLPRRDDQTLVSSIDLAPTILRACGLAPSAAMTGVDLLDVEALAARERVFGDVYAHDVASVDRPTESLQYRWMIDGSWKLIVPYPPHVKESAPELYDVVADPTEKRDRAGQNAARVERMQRTLDLWWPGPQTR